MIRPRPSFSVSLSEGRRVHKTSEAQSNPSYHHSNEQCPDKYSKPRINDQRNHPAHQEENKTDSQYGSQAKGPGRRRAKPESLLTRNTRDKASLNPEREEKEGAGGEGPAQWEQVDRSIINSY